MIRQFVFLAGCGQLLPQVLAATFDATEEAGQGIATANLVGKGADNLFPNAVADLIGNALIDPLS